MRHSRLLMSDIVGLQSMTRDQIMLFSSHEKVPLALVQKVIESGRLPVVTFAAGGIATPSDAALMMKMGMDGVFVGSGIFKSENPERMARAIVQAVTHYSDSQIIANISEDLGMPM